MTKKLWGSRFPKKTHILTERFTSSIAYDQRLARYDILGSIAHAKMLGRQRIIKGDEAALLVKGLNSLLTDLKAGKLKIDLKSEDIHSFIQNLLKKRIGGVADKLHTGRSRNDQIALDIRMYIKEEINNLTELLTQLQRSVLRFAIDNKGIIIPGYTHLQRAQCVLLSHLLLAYIEALERDKERLQDARERIDFMPLGSCAFSGTSLPLDRGFVCRQLGFKAATTNSIDSVADRDFIIEVVADLAIISVHLSRIAEDLILWSTQEFNFIDIDFSFCTGSSIMPHKKNPDVLELIRGLSGRIQGDLSSLLVLLKGLPTSYNRDLQLDKPPLFDALDNVKESLEILAELFENIVVKKEAIASHLKDESLFTVDIVEYLIKKGVSYRQAHDIVGRMVKDCLDKGKRISELSVGELKRFSPFLDLEIKHFLDPGVSVELKRSLGGTSPQLVAGRIDYWRRRLK